jgi:hypothetical protein
LAAELQQQFHEFKARVPHEFLAVGPLSVVASDEYATLRLNDMFALHATRALDDVQIRFLLCGSMLFQQMLLAGQIPRGGLGFGPIHREDDLLIGSGFIDAYEAAEKRSESCRDICAVLVSSTFMLSLPNKKRAYQLLCYYEGRFYVHPWGLVDPQLGEFDPARILELLERSGINQRKLEATRHFFENLEDYEAAMLPGSKTRQLREALGEPWRPVGKPEERP